MTEAVTVLAEEASPFSTTQLKALMGPLRGSRVKSRKQGMSTLSYLEAWDVRASLIRVFGFGNFSLDLIDHSIIHKEQVDVLDTNGNPTGRKHWIVVASATMNLTIHITGASYTEVAIAGQKGPDLGEVADFAIKTAESDALKRTATNLGTQFGLSLYDDGSLVDCVGVLLDPKQAEALVAGEVKKEGVDNEPTTAKAGDGE